MSNDKLSLGNFKLKKGDIEDKIIAKLLKKDSVTSNSHNEHRRRDSARGNLTSTEKAARIQALINIKNKKDPISISSPPVNNAPSISTNASQAIKSKHATKSTTYNKTEDQKRNKKPSVTQKPSAKKKKKRYTKHSKAFTHRKETDKVTSNKKYKHSSPRGEKRRHVTRKIRICYAMTIDEISAKTFEPVNRVITALQQINDSIDLTIPVEPETIRVAVEMLGHIPEIKLRRTLRQVLNNSAIKSTSMQKRPPIVTIMGHVDHGKTTLIDALRNSRIVATEHSGITQHIGAYQIADTKKNSLITIIDTPGHAAFTAMRARGAKVTDIAILVIAADDSIKEQTVEAINHIQAAQVPIIIAINKIDKPEANLERVVNELLQYNIVAEKLGGDVFVIPISAKDKLYLDKLEEAILLQAELLDITADPEEPASGIVLEASLNKKSGALATLIIENGTLKKGDIIVAGNAYCKVKAMVDCSGTHIKRAPPSTPVEVLGFNIVPCSGTKFVTSKTEKDIKNIIALNTHNASHPLFRESEDIDDLFAEKKKQVVFLIKADAQGSIEAIIDSINKFKIEQVDINLLHTAVGSITESDILLASASGARIISFCIKADKEITNLAKKHGIAIHYYSIIYDLIESIKTILSGFLPPIRDETILGNATVREVFNISKLGKIAGCYVRDGTISKSMNARLLRDSRLIYEGKIKNLRRFKKDEQEVKNGFECGIALENYADIKVGDVIESFQIVETKQSL